jgi:hypothetical protein
MADLTLRRRIAGLRGWVDLVYIGVGWQGRPWPDGGMDDVPEWDCDLAAAGELWAEIVSDDSTPLVLPNFTETYQGSAAADGRGSVAYVNKTEVPDPAERLARAIALLWLSWVGAA